MTGSVRMSACAKAPQGERPRLEVLPPSDPRAARAVRAFMEDIASRYHGRPATEHEIRAGLDEYPSGDLEAPKGLLVVALLPDAVIGCAGLRFVDADVAEVTRVHVAPPARRQGLGRRLMSELERLARERGIRRLRLDTRADLVEAQAMYRSLGYREIPPFNDGRYADHWLAKDLA